MISFTSAATYYVSPAGSDSNDGSYTHPFSTIQHGFSTMGSGDTLYIEAGTYYEQNLEPPAGLDNEHRTIVSGYPADGSVYPVIDADATAGTHTTAMVVNNDYITVQYLDLRNGGGSEDGTVSVATQSFSPAPGADGVSYITIDHCKISGTNTGGTTNLYNPCHIRLGYGGYPFNHVTVSNCELSGSYASGLKINSMYAGTSDITIVNNYIHDVASGVGVKWGDSINRNFTIENNFIKICSERGIYADQDYLGIINNIITGCPTGIKFHDNFGGSNCFISHNTVYGNTDYALYFTTGGSNNQVVDNIYYNTPSVYDKGANNMFTNNLDQDPFFVGGSTPATIAGFALTPGSPGYHAAGDGTDIGADANLVGIQGATTYATPPVCSNGQPTGTLASATAQTTLSLSTDEAATCRYSETAGVAYSSMTDTFSTTGGTSHSTTVIELTDGNSYNYYVRCIDGSGNANSNDYTIRFSVANLTGSCTSGADNDEDSVVSTAELIDYVSEWKSGSISISDLIAAIAEWKDGC